jgi:hypothetical protein
LVVSATVVSVAIVAAVSALDLSIFNTLLSGALLEFLRKVAIHDLALLELVSAA